MVKRNKIGLKHRFKILKRDGFRCQICGADQTTTILEVDHKSPVSCGGRNSDSNLWTLCFDCNRGKGDHDLTDDDPRLNFSFEFQYMRATIEYLLERVSALDEEMQKAKGKHNPDDEVFI